MNVNGEGATNKLQTTTDNKPAVKKEDTIASFFESMRPTLAAVLPKHLTPDKMLRLAVVAVKSNKKLLECDKVSLLAAVLQSAQVGLEPNTPLGEAYIIPYGKEAQFQMSYKGIISLAYKSEQYQVIYAMEVYANDEFYYCYGLNPELVHKPSQSPEGEPTFYYAVFKLKNGGFDFRVWPRAKVEKHALQYSQAYKKGWSSPWKSDFDAMAKKTVLKDLLKYAPKSVEFAKYMAMDETVKADLSGDMNEIPSIDITPDYDLGTDGEVTDNAQDEQLEGQTKLDV